MYSLGIPIGMFVDHRGPRPAVLAGSLLLAIGYFPLHQAYDSASGSVGALCFFSFLSGLGGCTAFSAAVKTSALNWPHHRGTATAFPLAAFGLSAFFFSFLGSIAFPGDPGGFLLLLACGTSGMTFVGFFFMKVYDQHSSSSAYQAVPGSDDYASLSDSHQFDRTSSEEPKLHRPSRAVVEPGMFVNPNSNPNTSTITTNTTTNTTTATTTATTTHITNITLPVSPNPEDVPGSPHEPDSGHVAPAENITDLEANEASPLVSRRSSLSGISRFGNNIDKDRFHRVDIRGLKLLRNLDFWQLFSIMGILAGVGLMTIKYVPYLYSQPDPSFAKGHSNIGNDAKALWKHYDESVSDEFLIKRQQLHVSILSIGSFMGRLMSGKLPALCPHPVKILT